MINLETAIQSSIHIQQMSSMCPEGINKLLEPNDNFKIIWIWKGQGSCCIDLERFKTDENIIFCVRPEQAVQILAEKEVEGYIISFSESFFWTVEYEDNILYRTALNQSIPKCACVNMQEGFISDMKEILAKMIKELENDCLFKIEMLKRYLKIFYLYVVRQHEDSFEEITHTSNIEMTQKFKALLDKNFIEKKLVSEYADMLFVTPNYLNTVIKKITGYSARQHIKQRVVLEAKRKATYSNLCMKEIAYYLGFIDISHFSKYFKNATGSNFSDFKKENYAMQVAM